MRVRLQFSRCCLSICHWWRYCNCSQLAGCSHAHSVNSQFRQAWHNATLSSRLSAIDCCITSSSGALCQMQVMWRLWYSLSLNAPNHCRIKTRKPSYRWQTRATRKPAKNCCNSTCLQRCRWQYWPIFIRLAVVASEICEIPRNSLKIQNHGVQGHPRSSILVSVESPCTTSY